MVRFITLGFLCTAATIAYMARNCIGTLESTIREDLELTKADTGQMMSAFFLAYALGQLPTSWISQFSGSRIALTVIAIVGSLATSTMTLAATATGLILSRVAMGIAQAGLFPNTAMVVSNWFPKNGRAFANGSLAACMSIGGAMGSAIAGGLLRLDYSWQDILLFYSSLGVFWAVLFWFYFRNDPSSHSQVLPDELKLINEGQGKDKQKPKKPSSTIREILEVFLSPATFWICAQQFFRAAGYIFFASWFATYLQEARGVERSTSGFLTALPLIAVVIGSLIGGLTSDWILKTTNSLTLARKGLASTCNALCAAFVFVAFFVESPVGTVLLVSIGTLAYAIGGPCAYSITIDLGGKQVGTLFASMNMIGNLGAYAFIETVGRYTDSVASESAEVQVAAWNTVFLGFGALFLLASFCWAMVRTDASVVEQATRLRQLFRGNK